MYLNRISKTQITYTIRKPHFLSWLVVNFASVAFRKSSNDYLKIPYCLGEEQDDRQSCRTPQVQKVHLYLQCMSQLIDLFRSDSKSLCGYIAEAVKFKDVILKYITPMKMRFGTYVLLKLISSA